MKTTPNIVEIASLIGDPSRALILMSLLGGKALPASELARSAHVTPQTASTHLAKLVDGGLLVQESYGRHRYYRLANSEVAEALEALNMIAPDKPVRSLRESEQSRALHFARTCYDHIAGEVGVTLADKLLELGFVKVDGRDFEVSEAGTNWFDSFGIRLNELKHSRRHFARQCLDWSERRHHISGTLGTAITNRLFELGWIERIPGGRAVRITETGIRGFEKEFNLTFAHIG